MNYFRTYNLEFQLRLQQVSNNRTNDCNKICTNTTDNQQQLHQEKQQQSKCNHNKNADNNSNNRHINNSNICQREKLLFFIINTIFFTFTFRLLVNWINCISLSNIRTTKINQKNSQICKTTDFWSSQNEDIIFF